MFRLLSVFILIFTVSGLQAQASQGLFKTMEEASASCAESFDFDSILQSVTGKEMSEADVAQVVDFLQSGKLKARGSEDAIKQVQCSHFAQGLLANAISRKESDAGVSALGDYKINLRLVRDETFCRGHFQLENLFKNLLDEEARSSAEQMVVDTFLNSGVLLPLSPKFEWPALQSQSCSLLAVGVTRNLFGGFLAEAVSGAAAGIAKSIFNLKD